MRLLERIRRHAPMAEGVFVRAGSLGGPRCVCGKAAEYRVTVPPRRGGRVPFYCCGAQARYYAINFGARLEGLR
jgi:hypothetical protein